MRVAKYDANPENPGARETLRFRFSDSELGQIAQRYAAGDPKALRFKLEVGGGVAKLVPTNQGGMAVTRSPSGKNHPWEVGFNHRSSPDISQVQAIPTSDAELELTDSFMKVRLPGEARASVKPPRAAPQQAEATTVRVSRDDFSGELLSPADLKLFKQALKTANELSERLGMPLQCANGKVQAIIT